MTKKSFKNDPTLQFISKPEETESTSATDAVTEETPTTEQNRAAQGTLFDVPMKRNPLYIETKSRRLNLLVQPSVFNKIKAAAQRRGVSMNEFIHSLLEACED
jgi:predicted DNA binding CopG/RHH family protein